jgi:hypothetical protein
MDLLCKWQKEKGPHLEPYTDLRRQLGEVVNTSDAGRELTPDHIETIDRARAVLRVHGLLML